MKISSKCCQVNMSSIMPQKLSTLRFMQNTHIKSILFLNNNQFGLVRSSSVVIFNRDSSVITRVITLPSEIDQVNYLAKNDKFYAYQTTQKQLISFNNEASPTITCLYNFNENAVNIKHEWLPWVIVFQESARIALVRKLYGQSLTVVFNLAPSIQKIWQFTCNQSSISKMDQSQYLVNYQQTNNKFNIKFVVYNCVEQQRYHYKIDHIATCICKGVKLYDKTVDKNLNGESRVWLKSLIGVNYKTNGSGIFFINLLEGNNNHYQVLSAITNRNAEINTILNVSIDKNIQVLDYRFIPQNKQTCHFFANYQWNDLSDKLLITDDKQLQPCSFDHAFNSSTRQLVTFSNRYEKKQIKTFQNTTHFLKLAQYKLFDKKIQYLQFLNEAMAYQNPSFFRQVLNLL